jgi:4-diphosphocytidyl-2-C-methyl-D-erythritol kinase
MLSDFLNRGKRAKAGALMKNDLQAPASRLRPEIARTLARASQAGWFPVLMTGSGPTVFALFSDRAAARRSQARIRRHWPGRKIILCHSL